MKGTHVTRILGIFVLTFKHSRPESITSAVPPPMGVATESSFRARSDAAPERASFLIAHQGVSNGIESQAFCILHGSPVRDIAPRACAHKRSGCVVRRRSAPCAVCCAHRRGRRRSTRLPFMVPLSCEQRQADER